MGTSVGALDGAEVSGGVFVGLAEGSPVGAWVGVFVGFTTGGFVAPTGGLVGLAFGVLDPALGVELGTLVRASPL